MSLYIQTILDSTNPLYLADQNFSILDALKAPYDSPAFTGIPTAPAPVLGTNTTQLATCAFVLAEIAAIAPGISPVSSVFGRTGAVVGISTDYSSVGITGTAIGLTSPSAGAFTTFSATGVSTLGVARISASDAPDDVNVPAAFTVSDPGNAAKRIQLGYNNSGDYGVFSAVHVGNAWKNIAINPIGGKVTIGSATATALFNVGSSAQFQIDGSGNLLGVAAVYSGSVSTSGLSATGNISSSAGYFLASLTGNNQLVLNSSGSNYGFVSNPSTGVWALGFGSAPGTLGTSVLNWNSSGVVNILGATSGNIIRFDPENAPQLDFGRYGSGGSQVRIGSRSNSYNSSLLFGYGYTGIFGATTNAWSINSDHTNSRLVFSASGVLGTNDRAVITTAGNFGVNTTAPPYAICANATSTHVAISVTKNDSYRGYLAYIWNSGSILKLTADSTTETVGFHGYATDSFINNGANFGVGTNTPSARLHSLSATEQFRLGYDATHYCSWTVSSAGNLTVAPSGLTAAFTGGITVTNPVGTIGIKITGANDSSTDLLQINRVVSGNSWTFNGNGHLISATNQYISFGANQYLMSGGTGIFDFRNSSFSSGTGTIWAGTLGIGTTSPTSKIHTVESHDITSADYVSVSLNPTFTSTSSLSGNSSMGLSNVLTVNLGSAAGSRTVTGAELDVIFSNSSTGSMSSGSIVATRSQAHNNSSSLTVGTSVGHDVWSGSSRAGGAVTTAYAINTTILVTGAVSTGYGIHVNDKSGSGTLTTQYGLYVESLTGGATNYAIYTAGTTPSLFGGALTISGLVNGQTISSAANFTGTVAIAGLTTITRTGDYQLSLKSTGSFIAGLIIDATSAGQQASILFRDNTVEKWQLAKQTDNSIFIFDVVAGTTKFSIASSGSMTLMSTVGITSAGNISGVGTLGCGAITSSGTLALGTNSITMIGSLGATGTRLTKGWFVDLEVTNGIVGSITGNAATASAVAAANLTGSTLASGVTGSNLTSFGSSPTIVTPTIASFTNATHSHQNAAGGGTLDAAAIASGTFSSARLSGSYSSITGLGTLGSLNVSSGATGAILDVYNTNSTVLDGTGIRSRVANDGSLAYEGLNAAGVTKFKVYSSGDVVGASFSGDGSGLTGLAAAQLTGTVNSARLSGIYSGITGLGTLGALTVTATITGSITGNAATASAVAAANLTGSTLASGVTGSNLTSFGSSPTIVTPTIASFTNATHSHQNAAGGGTLDAAAIASGTFSSARLSGSYSNITGLGTLGSLNVSSGATGAILDVYNTNSTALDGTGIRSRVANDGSLVYEGLNAAGVTKFKVYSSGDVVGASFSGDGSGLTGLAAAQLTGTVNSARLSGIYSGITGLGTLTGGVLAFNNATSNWINFGSNGVSAPDVFARSPGTKMVLYDSFGGGSGDYSIGVEGYYLWFATAGSGFKFYAGSTLVATVDAIDGIFSIDSIEVNGINIGGLDVTAGPSDSAGLGYRMLRISN